MDADALKLKLIRQILQTDDPEVLKTALGVLQLAGGQEQPMHPTSSTGTPAILQPGQPPRNEEARKLQDEIDELFGKS